MTKAREPKPIKLNDPPLSEIARQLEAWQRMPGAHARETELYWAQKLYRKALINLSNAQDNYHNGG